MTYEQEWERTPTEDLIREAQTLAAAIVPDLDQLERFSGAINDPAALADLLDSLRAIKKRAGEVYVEIERAYIGVAGEKKLEIPGLGLVEIKSAVRRTKWQHDEVFRSVISRLADEPGVFYDEETGERFPPAQLAANLVGRLRDVLSPSWKVTGLRDLGLDPDEFAETDEKHWSVALPPAKRPDAEVGEAAA